MNGARPVQGESLGQPDSADRAAAALLTVPGILGHMNGRLVSPVFAGRDRELTRLTEVYEQVRAGDPRTVLLGGEAGGGKSRLVHEFVARVRPDASVLVGGCLELSSAGLPYAPFTAALRQLARERGASEIARLLPAGAAGDLAGLLPEFGELPADPDAGTARARLFERVLTLMECLAQEQPLIWVVEDAHWADRSTRDLLVFLVRNMGAGPLMLLITFRSDELHRTHPLRPVLAELTRVEGVTRLELPRLSRNEMAAQLAGILGHQPTPAMLNHVGSRADGIPLFVETMIDSDGTLSRSLPASLRDLLISTVQRLPEETQEVLRVATATDHPGHALLATVTGLSEPALAATLRPAVAANVLVPDRDPGRDGYAFRHSLIREAIREDLLPGEHTRIHRRFAEALADDPALTPGDRPSVELALHWYAAHDAERALCSAWTAAQDSAAAHARAEQLQMLERVLELWEQVPDATEQIGADHTRVLELAAEGAHLCGATDRGLAFVRAALAELDQKREPERVALLLMLRARLRNDRALPGEIDDLRAAERLVPEPSVARLRVLSILATALILNGRLDEARPPAEESLALARELGQDWAEANALITLALFAGSASDVLGLLTTAREKAEGSGGDDIAVRALINVSAVLMDVGDNERGARAAREAFTRAKRLGRLRTRGAFAASNLAQTQFFMGHWDAAIETLRRAEAVGPVSSMFGPLRTVLAKVAVARGQSTLAARTVEETRAFFDDAATYPQEILPFVDVTMEHYLAEGDVLAALSTAERALTEYVTPHDFVNVLYVWQFLATAMNTCVKAAESAAERAAALRQDLHRHAERLPGGGRVSTAYRLTFLAESSHAEGPGDVAAWESAVAAWERLEQPYLLAYTRYRAAEATLAGGSRTAKDAVGTHLRRAVELADQLRARPLHRRIRQLARRAGVTLDPAAPESAGHEASRLGLTPRETEVLRLIADGNSNGEIAEKLFITTKTASVHVSNILAKLRVANRGEAAATAHRLHLFDETAE